MSDTNVLTAWRRAMVAHLQTNLPNRDTTEWDVRSGKRDGAVKDRKLAVVFVPPFKPDANINYLRPPLVIRAWLPRAKQPRAEVPMDPEPIEQLSIDLMVCLEPVRTTLLEQLYFELADVALDDDDWGVQVTLTGYTPNPASLPGV